MKAKKKLNIRPNKTKIINDPVYGFIHIPGDLIYDLIEHHYFQRLRRIKQLGLTHLVYPGALHTRFHHAIGSMYLMIKAIDVLRSKKIPISSEEKRAACIAILLHDIGHGPFSHSLEKTIVEGTTHERLSTIFMNHLNAAFSGQLAMALEMYRNEYPRAFFHQMIASQLDMDRLDYLKRDSFFTGVSEGVISAERIISMLNVKDNKLVVDEKGIYSVEKFLVSRRLMYWQVYMHKTVLAAENLLIKILERAKYLARNGVSLFCGNALKVFLYNSYGENDFMKDNDILKCFSHLDDFDIISAIKEWQFANDYILSDLCKRLINRRLYKIQLSSKPISASDQVKILDLARKKYHLSEEALPYYVFHDAINNSAYEKQRDQILILYKNGSTKDIAMASDQLNIDALSKKVKKYYLCFPNLND